MKNKQTKQNLSVVKINVYMTVPNYKLFAPKYICG